MRPLAVLLLVIAAGAALLIALLTLSGSEPRQTETVQTSAAPAEAAPAPRPEVELQEPERTIATPVEVDETPRETVGRSDRGAWPNRVFGKVTDPDGKPVSGAVLSLSKTGLPGGANALASLFADQNNPAPSWKATSGADGGFQIKNIEPGQGYTLVARHENFANAEAPFIEVPQQGDVEENVQLGEGFLVHGYVRNDQSAPIAGARLVLGRFPFVAGMPERPDPDRREVTTDGRGYYKFLNTSPGSHTVTVYAEGYGSQTKQSVLVGNKPSSEADFRLSPGLRIAGRVFGPDRQGIEGAVVEALMYKSELTSRGRSVSVEDGEFVIEDLAEGQYQLVVTAEGWGTERLNRIDAGQTSVEVEMHEQGGVDGRVVDAATGRPIREFTCTVRYVNAQSNVYGRAVRSQKFSGRSDGTFSISGIEQGTYAVQADAPGYAPTFSDSFNISQGALAPNVEVRMSKGGALRGVVLDATTGKPVQGAHVVTNENNWIDSPFTQLLGSAMARNTTDRKVRTNAKGEFLLKELSPETYQIKITHGDYTAEIRNNVPVTDGTTYDLGPVQLRAGATLRGVVYDAAGRPLAGAQINVTPTHPGAHSAGKFYQARTGSDGSYELRNIAQGDYKISAARPAGAAGRTGSPFDAIIDMKHSEVQLNFTEGGRYVQDLYLGE